MDLFKIDFVRIHFLFGIKWSFMYETVFLWRKHKFKQSFSKKSVECREKFDTSISYLPYEILKPYQSLYLMTIRQLSLAFQTWWPHVICLLCAFHNLFSSFFFHFRACIWYPKLTEGYTRKAISCWDHQHDKPSYITVLY